MKKDVITNIEKLDGVAVSANAQRVPLPPLCIIAQDPPVVLDSLGALVPEPPVAISVTPGSPPSETTTANPSPTNETTTE
jgi:hypothetical protein